MKQQIIFKSTSELIGKVLEDLSSFVEAGLVDEGKFYGYIVDIIKKLGIGYYKDEIAFLLVTNYKVALPKNFKVFTAAFKCNYLSTSGAITKRGVLESFHYYTDIHTEVQSFDKCCVADSPRITSRESVRVEHYIDNQSCTTLFGSFIPLNLGNNEIFDIVDFNSVNRNLVDRNGLTIAFTGKGYLNCSFNDGYVYLAYKALPICIETGLPLIPDVNSIELAILYYLEYQTLRNIWLNNSIADVERRMVFVKKEFDEHMNTAYAELNTPSYQSLKKVMRVQNKRFIKMMNGGYRYE